VLRLKIERGIGHFKESKKGIIAQLVKLVQGTGFSPGLGFKNGESVGQGQFKKVFVKGAGFF
jgi:hypothetical protein